MGEASNKRSSWRPWLNPFCSIVVPVTGCELLAIAPCTDVPFQINPQDYTNPDATSLLPADVISCRLPDPSETRHQLSDTSLALTPVDSSL